MSETTIEQVAQAWKEMQNADAERGMALETLEQTDEFKAHEEARKVLWETPEAQTVSNSEKKFSDASDRYKALVDEYKKSKIETYINTGEKQYPGGNIRVNKKLFVSDEIDFVEELAEKKMFKLLQPNESKFKEFSDDALDLLGISRNRVRWTESPSASIASDLSEYL